MYGVHKVWHQLRRDDVTEGPRCTVARLIHPLGLRSVVRRRQVRTTTSAATLSCTADRVNRVSRAQRPNALWVVSTDLTFVAT